MQKKNKKSAGRVPPAEKESVKINRFACFARLIYCLKNLSDDERLLRLCDNIGIVEHGINPTFCLKV